jgi:hypothetical protein
MNRWKPIVLVLFVLTGCDIIQQADRLEIATYDRIAENIQARRMIRDECMDIMKRQIDAFVAAEDYEGLKAYLKEQYPPLLTQQFLDNLGNDRFDLPELPLVGCE